MKVTDYCPRAAVFDSYLTGNDLEGAEVGVDVGAHAEALLRYCNVRMLHLVDLWPREFYKGWCHGRLYGHGYKNRVRFLELPSNEAAKQFDDFSLDFVYIDITHDSQTVRKSLEDWWPKLKHGGIMGYRNYSPSEPLLKNEVDRFVETNNLRNEVVTGEIVLFKK